MRQVVLLLIVMTWLAPRAPALDSSSYLPLEVGNRWAYSGDIVGPDIKEVQSGADPHFYGSYVIVYDVSDHSLGLRNFWSTNAEGDVFLHGFARLSPRANRFYEPPLKVVDAPLTPGKSWASTVDIVNVPGGPPVGSITIRYTATDPETMVIKGTVVSAFGVLEGLESAPVAGVGEEWSTDGRPFDLAKEGDVIVPHWWVAGIGEVRYRSIGIFELSDYFVPGSVSNQDWNWSELKRRFR